MDTTNTAPTLSVERLRDGALITETFARGQWVHVSFSSGSGADGEIAGVSVARRSVRLAGSALWYLVGICYHAERPAPPAPKPTVGLARVIERMNRRNEPPGGWNDSHRVPVL